MAAIIEAENNANIVRYWAYFGTKHNFSQKVSLKSMKKYQIFDEFINLFVFIDGLKI